MAISGVRSVPKNTNSATTLKNSPVQFVHAYAILSTASYAVRHILKTIPKVSERPPVRARFHPENSATGEDRRALGRIGNIQNKLLKALYGKGSPKIAPRARPPASNRSSTLQLLQICNDVEVNVGKGKLA